MGNFSFAMLGVLATQSVGFPTDVEKLGTIGLLALAVYYLKGEAAKWQNKYAELMEKYQGLLDSQDK